MARIPVKLTFLSISVLSGLATQAGELTFAPEITLSGVQYETDYAEREDLDNTAIVLKPSLTSNYDSRIWDAALSVKHTAVFQDENSSELDKSFTDYRFNSDLSLWDDRLGLQVSSSRTKRATSQADSLVVDPLLGASELVKSRNRNAVLSFESRDSGVIAFSGSASAGEVETGSFEEGGNNSFRGLNNKNYQTVARLYQGNDINNLYFDITSQYSLTKREAERGDFESRNLSARAGVALTERIYAIVRGNDDSNKIEDSEISSGQLESTTYGAGLEWRRSSNRYIAVTYNQYEQNDRKQQYVGLDLNWAFTQRTSVSANIGKRFFGDSYQFSLEHNTKHWRSQIGYSDSLTSFTRQQLVTEDLGVFVCPIGELDPTQCFQPDSPNYEPGAGEQFLNFVNQDIELSEEVILNKSAFASLGFERRKISLSLNYRYSEQEYIERAREQRTSGMQFSATYEMGPRTSLQLQSAFSKTENLLQFGERKATNSSIGINRELNRDMDLNLSYRYVDNDNEGDTFGGGLSAQSYTDHRVTLSLVYRL
ncbi:TIGR03016 family PEP-CTERM system-associated outer membrane protein [Bowmanella dokdonensis]|uniref:TIGR03016 family PEP-CTERM system-associated outer membrane protein n=1 Tax=Bowmanella dokdonensis TaxID=751969 RepID=A0A939DQ85_9ALTE|nr:TIGR03016 family PEP-CTERM system-associated outer membrane protein [Bowmanella dokdonensis]